MKLSDRQDRVNLSELRAKQEKAQQLLDEYFDITGEIFKVVCDTPFCDTCGRVSPSCNFYPLLTSGPNSVSGLICNDCADKRG